MRETILKYENQIVFKPNYPIEARYNDYCMTTCFSLIRDNESKTRQERSRSLNKMKNTLTVAILVVCLKPGSGLLNQKPQDSVAIAGESAYFNCSTSEPSKPILWYHYATNEVHRENIYQYANFTDYWYPCYRKGRYVVEKNPATGAFNLVLPMVLLSDAGRYLCEVDGDEGVATLTVHVESSPTCVASEICKPYIKWYSAAIICIILIILLIAIGGTISVLWYLRVYRPKKQRQKGNKEADANNTPANTEASSPEGTEHLLRRPSTDDLTRKIQELETEPERERSEAKALENQLSGNIDYAEKPTLVRTITTNASKQRRVPINGMTILGRKLFVSHENESAIEVYDSETFQLLINWTIAGMLRPMDIASCKIANCLYIISREYSEPESHIMKLNLNGQVIKNWSSGGERGRLSTYESNVIVCIFEKQLINEFSGNGNLLHTVPLSSCFNHPWHAIKVAGSHFAVCHGVVKDELHRVCIVDKKGSIVKELKKWESIQNDGKWNVPVCLAEDSERSILVADRGNQTIRLLNCHLKLQRNLIIQEMGLDGYPVRIFLDEIKGRLFVAANTIRSNQKEWRDGRILIFNIR